MSFILTRSAVAFACAALIGAAVVPALAQTEEMPPPSETQQDPYGGQQQSRPTHSPETARDHRLNQQAGNPPSVCKYGDDYGTMQEAIDYCAPILQCQPPKTTKCRKGTTGQGWICRCG